MRDRKNSKSRFFQKAENNKHCWYCGEKFTKKKKPTLDHIYPVWKYGKNADILENYAMCCKKCNSEKGGLDPLEWINTKGIITEEILNIINKALAAIYNR